MLALLIFSVICHEVSHGLVALGQGDDTALVSGRLTLNPLPHLDPLGSVIFPAICVFANLPVFGWAKPVPINPNRFHNYRLGVILVSLAGPVSNLVLAVGCTAIFYFGMKFEFMGTVAFLPSLFQQVILLNIVLAVFNLVPVPPLDGSRLVSMILPYDLAIKYDALEPYGFIIVMVLVATHILQRVLSPVVEFVYTILLKVFGII